MEYHKPPLSYEKQAELLIQRGLIADKGVLVERLENVNYYRLSGYLFPYRQADDSFKAETTFEEVWKHYTFDRRLRLIVMDAIERIEVSVKTQLIYNVSHKTQAFGYMESECFPMMSVSEHESLVKKIVEEVSRSKERFVGHFKNKYGNAHRFTGVAGAEHIILPLWMVGEILSFGTVLTAYRGVSNEIKGNIAKRYHIPVPVLTSWLQTVNVIRNICAHHGRLWNRELGVKPYIPRKNKYPEWHDPVAIPRNRVFGVLTILRYLLKIIAPQSNWKKRFMALLDEYPNISRWSMGFSDNWQESPLWKE